MKTYVIEPEFISEQDILNGKLDKIINGNGK